MAYSSQQPLYRRKGVVGQGKRIPVPLPVLHSILGPPNLAQWAWCSELWPGSSAAVRLSEQRQSCGVFGSHEFLQIIEIGGHHNQINGPRVHE